MGGGAEELADRKRQGLTGDAAIKHYNDWMDFHGMRRKEKELWQKSFTWKEWMDRITCPP